MLTIAFICLSLAIYCSGSPRQEGEKTSLEIPDGLESRIYYGYPAKIRDYPFFAHLRGCGGAIISNKWIVTAAHCVDSYKLSHRTSAWVGGETKANGLEVKVQTIVIHPNYTYHGSVNHDIALLKLKKELKFSNKIQPIELPRKSDNFTTSECVFIGRGEDETGKQAKWLQMSKMTRYEASECYRRYYPTHLYKKGTTLDMEMLCTIREKNMPFICYGDSGSPLVQEGVLVGLASYTYGSDDSCDEPAPSFFVNVRRYVGWIKGILRKHLPRVIST